MADAPLASEPELRKAAEWLSQATHILVRDALEDSLLRLFSVGAGAGMSVEAGNDYHDKKEFARLYPGMYPYELVGFREWPSDALKWGYLASHVNHVRFELPPHKVYGDLIDVIKTKEHFVLTSNVDGMFVRNSLDPLKVYTTQGDFEWLQCLKPCTRKVWPMKPYLEKIIPSVNRETQEISDLSVLPMCPNCGGQMMLNVRGGDWFIEDHFKEQQQRMITFLTDATKAGSKLVLLEIGVGFNTPTVIRHRFEVIAYQHLNQGTPVNFIRLNLHHPDIPEEIKSCSLSLKAPTGDALTSIKKYLSETKS